MSAIFISHSSKDNAWAERIAAWLRDEPRQRPAEHRYDSLFLDVDPEDGIQLGQLWRDTLYEKLQLCVAVIVICSEAYAASQWCLAELGIAMARGALVLPVRIDASPLPKLLSETQATKLTVIDLEQGSDAGWERLLKGLAPLSWQSRLPWPPPEEPGASPFPGLLCFERWHAPVFFGQDAVRQLVQDTIRELPQRQSRLLLILGASGCGKSSLLRAGMVPWLAEADRRRWIVLEPFRPGKKPFDWLHQTLAEGFKALGGIVRSEPARTAEQMSDQLEALRCLAKQQDARVVISIDQFEELLSRNDDRDPKAAAAADAFLTQLAELLAKEGSQVLILATLRSDFYGLLQLHPSGLHRLAGQPIPLGPMEVGGFRQVIEGPAQRVGLPLETGLSDQLVADTATGDALPLLAFTLRELWDGRAAGAGLTLQQYRDFGGLEGAVQRRADDVLKGSDAMVEEIAALQEAFVGHLVRLTNDGQAAKQPARRQALPAASRRLVDKFVAARLLVSGKGADRDAVEIAHEALLRTWPTLVKWIGTGKEALLQRLRVRRLGEDLMAEASERQRRQALEQLAALAAAGGGEADAVQREASQPLVDLLAAAAAAVADREDAALVLALIGAEEPLRQLLADGKAPVGLRRRAAECLGLLARRCGNREQRQRIATELARWLRSEPLEVRIEVELDPKELDPVKVQAMVEQAQGQLAEALQQAIHSGQLPPDLGEEQLREMFQQAVSQMVVEQLRQPLWAEGRAPGWAVHDAHLPLLQGAARGVQLAASADLPLLGSGPGLAVPMLKLMATEEEGGLWIRTEVVEVPVWKLPLPPGDQLERGEYLELVMVPAGDTTIGSPAGEAGRDVYRQGRLKCDETVDVEARRPVRLSTFAMVRHPISQGQWRAVVEGVASQERDLEVEPGKASAESLWDQHGQPGELAVDSVSWHESQEWLRRLNVWLVEHWRELGGNGEAPQLALPSESQWEAACRGFKPDEESTPFHFGATLDASWARYDYSSTFGLGRKRLGAKVKQPGVNGAHGLVNRLGLAELHGQVFEWCGDQWHRDPVAGAPVDGSAIEGPDPDLRGTSEEFFRLLRGGSWPYDPHHCRAAYRLSGRPAIDDAYLGLRPCCPSPPGSLLGS